jgi:hypothetical protein
MTIGYFRVLGANGGTVFQRLFGIKRATDGADVYEVIKTVVRPDQQRRVQIYRRNDGLFSAVEEQRMRDRDGEPYWRPFPPFAAACDSPEAAERQARSAVRWLRLMPGDSPVGEGRSPEQDA